MFGRQIETSIEIAAPPSKVWELLTAEADCLGTKSWNPFLVGFEGQLEEGSHIAVTIQVPGGRKPQTFKPKLLAVKPGEELRWRGSLPIPGLFVGEHYYRVEPAPSSSSGGGSGQGSTRFVHGEHFSGLLVPLVGGMLADTEKGFVAMNEALKKAAEQGS
ncbi:hypothetical protein ABPG75_004477 [Micractinium tetrahymenae]